MIELLQGEKAKFLSPAFPKRRGEIFITKLLVPYRDKRGFPGNLSGSY